MLSLKLRKGHKKSLIIKDQARKKEMKTELRRSVIPS